MTPQREPTDQVTKDLAKSVSALADVVLRVLEKPTRLNNAISEVKKVKRDAEKIARQR